MRCYKKTWRKLNREMEGKLTKTDRKLANSDERLVVTKEEKLLTGRMHGVTGLWTNQPSVCPFFMACLKSDEVISVLERQGVSYLPT